jgi:Mn-dependent DtxR family transcriptional regulator
MSAQRKIEAYLAATMKVSKVPGRVFSLADVCLSLQWDWATCDEVSTQLEKAGLLNRLPNDQAILTSAGMRRVSDLSNGD